MENPIIIGNTSRNSIIDCYELDYKVVLLYSNIQCSHGYTWGLTLYFYKNELYTIYSSKRALDDNWIEYRSNTVNKQDLLKLSNRDTWLFNRDTLYDFESVINNLEFTDNELSDEHKAYLGLLDQNEIVS